MKKYKQYKYIGRNGIITSPIKLDGINFIPMTRLEAEPGYILTNGTQFVYAITVEDDELNMWSEVVDNIK
jgi:hypothetical protein